MNMAAQKGLMSHDVFPTLSSVPDYDILSALPMGCAIFDYDGYCIYLNPTGQLLIGHRQFCSERVQFYQTPSENRAIRPYPTEEFPLSRALRGDTVTCHDVMFLRQGKPIVLEMQASPTRLKLFDQQGAIVLFKEISPHQQSVHLLEKEAYFYRRLAENMPGSFQYTMYPNGQGALTYVSPNFYDFYGISPDWILAHPDHLWEIVSPTTINEMKAEVIRSYETMTPWVHQGILITPKGQQWFQGYAVPEKFPNGNIVWHGFTFDITAQKLAELKRKETEEQLNYLTQTILGVPFHYVLNEDGSYGFVELDERIVELYGVDRQAFLNHPETLESIAHPTDRHSLQSVILQTLANPESFNVEYRIVTPKGVTKWVRMIARHQTRSQGGHHWNGMILDITERKQVELILTDYNESLEREVHDRTIELELEIQERKRAEETARRAEAALRAANHKLELLVTLDGLTQVANRRRFDSFLNQTWRMTMREGQKMSVVMCDVDYFKRFNDTYGHQAGDVCLQKIAQAIKSTANRAGDLVARYGGEEFALVLGNTDENGAKRLCEKLQRAIEALKIPHSGSETNPYVTLSIGICTMIPNLRVLPESLITCADKALYEAKHQGRDRIVHSVDLLYMEECH
jgi:diguanylate cyclase (GGDEF)-like protein/PAS domain S-box-containing protein